MGVALALLGVAGGMIVEGSMGLVVMGLRWGVAEGVVVVLWLVEVVVGVADKLVVVVEEVVAL